MRRELTIKTCSLAGTSDLTVVGPIRKGLVPSLDSMTYKTRVKRVLRTLHLLRSSAHESELARMLSDAVERVGRIHSVRIAVLEEQNVVLLAVTFDGAWESYIRVIWQKVASVLDLVFCNTEDYVTGWDHSYEEWAAWLRGHQAETSFLYATPGTAPDNQFLRMQERVERRIAPGDASYDSQLRVTRMKIPAAEEIADGLYQWGQDPTNLECDQIIDPAHAGRMAFRQGIRALVGLYRLAALYPPATLLPGTTDGVILHRAARELLRELMQMLGDGAFQSAVDRANERFAEQIAWITSKVETLPPVREPVPLPEVPPVLDTADVQGGIVRPYPATDHGCLMLVGFDSDQALAAFIGRLRVTTESDDLAPGELATNIAFTVEGLRVAGLTEAEIDSLPQDFVQGMERRAGLLGDLRINHPRRWRLPERNWDKGIHAGEPSDTDDVPRVDLGAVHAVVQLRLRSPDPASPLLTARVAGPKPPREQLLDQLKACVGPAGLGVVPLSLQWMERYLVNDNAVDHFGFIDGRSQPVLNQSEAGKIYPNQVHLGEVLHGYANAVDAAPGANELLRNGSFLVVRKLRQDVGLLEQVLQEAVASASAVEGGIPITREELLAKMVGRWPTGHAKAGEPLAFLPNKDINDFNYKNDETGSDCPFQAHIRRANPRLPAPGPKFPSSIGTRPPRLFRRGMPYGPRFDPKATVPQERGLVFMAYNNSIGEQFEVVQRWLTGGNSTDSYSAQGDPLMGLAEAGRRRFFRFEHAGQTVRMALDGSDQLDAEPAPLVRLEWGAYLFAPSITALKSLRGRASAGVAATSVPWSSAAGERQICGLRAIESSNGEAAAILAWKAALEDPEASSNFITASIWKAIREKHGGVLDTPYGVLVADTGLVDEVLLNTKGKLSARGYLPRMDASFGGIFLGHDAGEPSGTYKLEAPDCTNAIMNLDVDRAYWLSLTTTLNALTCFAEQGQRWARDDGESRWEVALDVRELVDLLLGDLCEEWFGLSEDSCHFKRGGYHADWKPTEIPFYPGHFMAPSRYFFQPRPGEEVAKIGAAHGKALNTAMTAFLQGLKAPPTAPVTLAILGSAANQGDPGYAARTVVGAIMGFVPTIDGNLRRVLNEWLLDGTLWSLRERHAGKPAKDRAAAEGRILDSLTGAMQLRSAPELLWRTATVAHTIGLGEHAVAVKQDDIVVAALVSALQQGLEEGSNNLCPAFGGQRRPTTPPTPTPTHACPGYDAAMAVMVGFFEALAESPLPIRAGPGPLTLTLSGPTPGFKELKENRQFLLQQRWDFQFLDVATVATVPVLALGDSWLVSGEFYPSLAGALGRKGYLASKQDSRTFTSLGRRLAQMAEGPYLNLVVERLRNAGPNPPRAVILGGGGNDVKDRRGNPATAPLYDMLRERAAPGVKPLDDDVVGKFIDGELRGYYQTIVTALVAAHPTIPILIHAYDHPIPDDRGLVYPVGRGWLNPIFEDRKLFLPGTADVDVERATGVMKCLIERLDTMVGHVAADFPGRVHHVRLCGTLAAYPYPQKHTEVWANELHPNAKGFDLLAAVVADKLRELNIR